jgi:hypothetical protein
VELYLHAHNLPSWHREGGQVNILVLYVNSEIAVPAF